MMSEAATFPAETATPPTALALQLQAEQPGLTLRMHAGSLTPQSFSPLQQELSAALSSSAVFDIGYRTRIRVTGEDRLRWLNGMVSNAIQTLPDGHGNYNFILNAQGRIQGDAYIYRSPEFLLLDTDRSQASRLFQHLDHFIIMDDVELRPLDEGTTGIGLMGPQAEAVLRQLGLPAAELGTLQFIESKLNRIDFTLVKAYSLRLPRYELWFDPSYTAAMWASLTSAGGSPIGIDAVECLRVLDGTPLYGVDFTDRHLAQETSQTRALNFTKGCYLGQEIVERIRSRATVHRNLRQFELRGEAPAVPVDLHAGDGTVTGQVTSVAEFHQPGLPKVLGIGFIRTEALDRRLPVEYAGGTAIVLDHPPELPLQ